jgi:hypothetical protein
LVSLVDEPAALFRVMVSAYAADASASSKMGKIEIFKIVFMYPFRAHPRACLAKYEPSVADCRPKTMASILIAS